MASREITKRGKNFVIYSDGTMRIDNVRGSYVHADKPYKGKAKRDDGGEAPAKYSIVGIMPKDTHEEAYKACCDFIKKILADNKDAKVGKKDWFVRDGDDSAKDEYENAWTVNASEQRKPKCRDRAGELVDDPEDIREKFQSGYWFNILIRPWFQDNDYGKKVNAGFTAIQFVKKDKTFGMGEIDDSDVWDKVEGDDGMDGDDGL
jgi:hypothetical protein